MVLVSCLPVLTLGFGAALAHLLRSGAVTGTADTVPHADETTLMDVPETAFAGGYTAAPRVPEDAGARTRPAAARPLSKHTSGRRGAYVPERIFRAEIEAGRVPGIREIKRSCKVGQDRAVIIRDELAALVSAPSETMA